MWETRIRIWLDPQATVGASVHPPAAQMSPRVVGATVTTRLRTVLLMMGDNSSKSQITGCSRISRTIIFPFPQAFPSPLLCYFRLIGILLGDILVFFFFFSFSTMNTTRGLMFPPCFLALASFLLLFNLLFQSAPTFRALFLSFNLIRKYLPGNLAVLGPGTCSLRLDNYAGGDVLQLDSGRCLVLPQ